VENIFSGSKPRIRYHILIRIDPVIIDVTHTIGIPVSPRRSETQCNETDTDVSLVVFKCYFIILIIPVDDIGEKVFPIYKKICEIDGRH